MPICLQELSVKTIQPADADNFGLEDAFRGAFGGYVPNACPDPSLSKDVGSTPF